MNAYRTMPAFLALLLLSGCSLFGVRGGYEQPGYDIAATIGDDIEIRRYGPRLAAETAMPAADGSDDAVFRLLFDYISGGNRLGVKIAMTVPVETEAKGREIAMTVPVETARQAHGAMRMRFFLPQDYDLDTAPQPTDPRVTLAVLPAATVAAIRFSGWADDAKIASKTAALKTAVEAEGWRPAGEAATLYYDPPWTLPWLRRTEVALPVSR